MHKHIFGLSIQGIQSYIFETNKLKEIIGASEIVEQACTNWFDDFINSEIINGRKILGAAGNIRYVTYNEEDARKLIEGYHSHIIKNAPGLPFSMAIMPLTSNTTEKEALLQLTKQLEAQRNQPMYAYDPGIMTRNRNRRTGSAATFFNDPDGKYIDKTNLAKFKNHKANRLYEKTLIPGYEIKYPLEFSNITKEGIKNWMALVHIDGNGMGIRISEIYKKANILDNLSEFSKAIDNSTVEAYRQAVIYIMELLNKKPDEKPIELPMRPLILGGDDLTLIIRADLAMEFVRKYLESFETETEKNIKAEYGGKFTAAAGIVFMKEKFPFHYAAHLVEELTSYAKNNGGREQSTLHFYMVQDSFIENYDEIIERELTPKYGDNFINGPYSLKPGKCYTIDSLLEDIEILQSDEAPVNGIREFIDLKFNDPKMAEVVMKRLKNKYRANHRFVKILENEQAFMDYHTLLSVGTRIKNKK